MASYYYLIASLPTLKTDGEMPLSYEDFLECCRTNVGASLRKTLEQLTLLSDGSGLLKEWKAYYGALMNELNYQRSLRLGKTSAVQTDRDPVTSAAVAAALSAQNPLESEKLLLEYEFNCLDSLVSMHYFDDYVLLGYAIKLKLLERLSCFDHDKGSKEFEHLFSKVQQRVLSL